MNPKPFASLNHLTLPVLRIPRVLLLCCRFRVSKVIRRYVCQTQLPPPQINFKGSGGGEVDALLAAARGALARDDRHLALGVQRALDVGGGVMRGAAGAGESGEVLVDVVRAADRERGAGRLAGPERERVRRDPCRRPAPRGDHPAEADKSGDDEETEAPLR